jgi:predicted ArsR family transcriptional regulator
MADDFISPEYILSIGTGFSAAKTLLSAVELDVFTALARQPGSAVDLEQRLGLHPRASRDFLDALVALGVLERRDGVYINTPPAARYLDRQSDLHRSPARYGQCASVSILGRPDGRP